MASWPRNLPHPALIFVVVAWGLNFSIIKLVYHDFTPPAVAVLRILLMAPVLVAWCWFSGTPLKADRADVFKLWLAGAVSSGIYIILFMEGMKLSGAAQGAVMLATAPIFTGFFSILLKQDEFRWNLVWGSMIAFVGVGIVKYEELVTHPGSLMGGVLVLLSAIVWSVGVVMMKPLVARIPPLAAMTISIPGAIFVLIPYGIVAVWNTKWAAVTWVGWFSLIYLIVIAGAGAFVAYYKSLQDIGPARTGMVQYVIPPMAAFGAWMILGSPVSLWQIVGLAVALVGVYFGSRKAPAQPQLDSA